MAVYFGKTERASPFHQDLFDDLERVAWAERIPGAHAIAPRWISGEIGGLLQQVNSGADHWIVCQGDRQVGLLVHTYDRKRSCVEVPFFCLLSPYRSHDLLHGVVEGMMKTFLGDWQAREVTVRVHRLCRCPGDHEVFRQFGFRKQEWAYMCLSIKNFNGLFRDIPGFRIVPWDDRFLVDITHSGIEAAYILRKLLEGRSRELDREASVICLRDETFCGFVLAGSAGHISVIEYLFVSEAYRCRNLGRALMESSLVRSKIRDKKDVFLEVSLNNAAGMALFQHIGFSTWGCSASFDYNSG